jgi:hypothetical protein
MFEESPAADARSVRQHGVMKLSALNGHALELSVLGYQFPTGTTEWHDRNWLNVRTRVVHPRGHWLSTAPTLLTSEVAQLADWLDAVAKGDVTEGDLPFTEPNLRFEVTGDVVRVYFELESRPSWAKVDGAPANDLWVEFPLAEINLGAAAEDLRGQLERYPVRPGD